MSSMLWKTDEARKRQYDPMPLAAAEKIALPESELCKMTIKGLTDREAEFPRIGELRKGAARTKEDLARKRPGKDLFSFLRFTSQDNAVMRRFIEVYGSDEVNELLVYLPGKTAGENFDAWKEHWVAGGLVHRCDGETCTVWRDENGEYQHTPKPCPGDCKETGRFRVILPELRRLAYVTVLTSSKHDILNLPSQLRAFQSLRGDLRGIPFRLSRVKRMVSTPGSDGKRARREKWLLAIEPAQEWVHLQIEATRVAALPQLEAAKIDIIDSETGEIVEAEAEPEDDNGWEGEGDQGPFDAAEVPEPEPEDAKSAADQQRYDDAHAELLSRAPGAPPPSRAEVVEPAPRPFIPERLIYQMRIKIERSEEVGIITPNQLALVAGKLNEVWAGDGEADNNRRSVLKYLFAVDSAKDLTAAQAAIVLDWLIQGKDEAGDYPLKPMAEQEARLIVRQYVEDAGQLTMEMEQPRMGDD